MKPPIFIKSRRDRCHLFIYKLLRYAENFYASEGIPLWLNGMPSTPKEIEKAHKVAEDVTYMRDYVRDSSGRLTRLEFDSVKDI